MSYKPEENNISKEEIDSLKEEIKDLKKTKEFEDLKAEVYALKSKEFEDLKAEVYYLKSKATQSSDPKWDKIKSKRTTAGILALFFGFLGIHKFILGYTAEGLILLLFSVVIGIITCGLSIIVTDFIGILEGIIILTKTPEEFKRTYIDKKTAWF
tara:strand:+ start:376 stop:840 length:465 start_codon:yes stop_codon:yes gene_type:complete